MRKRLASTAIVGALLFSVSCGDSKSRSPFPTSPQAALDKDKQDDNHKPSIVPPASCITGKALEAEVDAVLGKHGDRENKVADGIKDIEKLLDKNKVAEAQAEAFSLVKLILAIANGAVDDGKDGKHKHDNDAIPGTAAQVAKLVHDVFCFAGVNVTITDPANSAIVVPSNIKQTVQNSTGSVGTQIPPNALQEPTVIEFVPIPGTFGLGAGPLHTKLDQYSGFYYINSTSAGGLPLNSRVIVEVCPDPSVPSSIRTRLRLGHDRTVGFEVTPPEPAGTTPILTCPPALTASTSKLPGWLRSLASLVLPKPAYARMQFFATGGVGGTAGEFSPFGPVDPVLSFSGGGVGGTAGEFTRIPKAPAPLPPAGPLKPTSSTQAALQLLTPGPRVNTVIDGACTERATVWGGVLEPECSPVVVLKTHLGTKLTGVPVTWAIGIGGGTVAIATPSPWACSTFGGVVNATTDANGESHVCWTLGGTPGSHNNTVVATPSAGGDAPAGVTFVPISGTFTASALRRTPTVTATGANVTFDNAFHPGSGTCSNGLTPLLTYSGDGSVPKNAGSYTLTVTCGDGNLFYNTVMATAAIVISPAATATVVSCPATATFTGTPLTPCTVSVTGPALSLSPAPTYTNNAGIGTATASYTFGGGGNYLGSSATASIAIVGTAFTDGFETESGWTATGFWNRSTLMNGANPIVNTLFPTYVDLAPGDNSNGALPAPFAGSYAFWYGDPATGSYRGAQNSGDFAHSGGMSALANSGTLTSPNIALPVVSGASIKLRFNSWFDIESVNPSSFDLMQLSIQDVATGSVTNLGVLNPASDPAPHGGSTPWTSGGYNVPPAWVEVVHDLTAFSGKTVRLIYTFNTLDFRYNGFRGWIIDNVRVAAEGTSASATRLTRPRIIGGPSQPDLPIVTLQRVPAPTIRPRPQP